MKLKQIASNVTEIELEGKSVMFSYETPVAGWDDKGAFRTSTYYSVTTSKHINKYFNGVEARKVSQEYINGFLMGIKQ